MQDTIFHLKFSINYCCSYGYSVYLIGDLPNLGSWRPHRAIKLQWNKNDNWSLELKLSTSTPCPKYMQYKYLIAPTDFIHDENAFWEDGLNRVINLTSLPQNTYHAIDTWSFRWVRLTVNDVFTTHKILKNYCPVILGNIADVIGKKGPFKMDLQELKVITKTRAEKNELRWTATFLIHHTVSQFEYRYMIYDRITGKYLMNRKVNKKFVNPLPFGTPTLNSTTSYQMLDGAITKIDRMMYENFVYDRVLPNVIVGSSLNTRYEVELLRKEGVNFILDVQTEADMNENGADHAEVNSMLKENKIGYLNFPIEEKNSKKLAKGCRGGCELLKQLLDHKKVVYLHCKFGALRSVHTLLSYLVIHKKAMITQAVEFIKRKRKVALPSKELLSEIVKMDNQETQNETQYAKFMKNIQPERRFALIFQGYYDSMMNWINNFCW